MYYTVLTLSTSLYLSTFCLHRLHRRHRKVDNIGTTSCWLCLHPYIYQLTVYIVYIDIAKLSISVLHCVDFVYIPILINLLSTSTTLADIAKLTISVLHRVDFVYITIFINFLSTSSTSRSWQYRNYIMSTLSTLIYFSSFCLQRLHRRHREVDNIGTTSCRRCLHPYTYQLTVYIADIAKLTISVLHRVDFVYITKFINFLPTLSTSRSWQYRNYIMSTLSKLIYFSFFCLQRLHRRRREVDNIGTTTCRRCLHPYTYQLTVYIADIAKLTISVIRRVDFVYLSTFCLHRLHRRHREVDNIGTTSCRRCLHPYTYQPTVYIADIAKLTILVLHRVDFVYITKFINFLPTLSTSRSWQYRNYIMSTLSKLIYFSFFCLQRLHRRRREVDNIGTTTCRRCLHPLYLSTYCLHRRHREVDNIGNTSCWFCLLINLLSTSTTSPTSRSWQYRYYIVSTLSTSLYLSTYCLHRRHREVDNIGNTSCWFCLHPYTYQPSVYIDYIADIAKLTISVLHHVDVVYIPIFINLLSTSSTSPTSRSWQYRYYIMSTSSTSLYLSTLCLHCLHRRHCEIDNIGTTSCWIRLHRYTYQLSVYIAGIASWLIVRHHIDFVYILYSSSTLQRKHWYCIASIIYRTYLPTSNSRL